MTDARRAAVSAANAADATRLRDRVTAAFGEQYLIGEELGRGGMAVVYAAEDVRLQRQVALKVLPPDLAFRLDVRERFVREAQTAARLNHPHIVPIYAVHEDAGMVCFAMGLVRGDSVAARLVRDPRPPFEFVASVLEQTADALAYAHACGVVHRDVKPDNILLDSESGRAMVTDFGIARAAEGGSRLTQTGVAVGTPAFMSPEQATGDKEVDGRSDVYSLGVVGFLMLAGRLPFEASTTPAMLLKHVSESPPPLASMRPDAPRALVGILERCLAKRPADRWESALALRDALRRVQRDGSLRADRSAAASGYTPQPVVPALPRVRDEQIDRDRDRDRGRMERAYAEKAGHRAEDWAPRAIAYAPQHGEADGGARIDRLSDQHAPSHHSPTGRAERIARTAPAFKRHLTWVLGSAIVGGGTFAIGASLSLPAMVVPFIASVLVGIASTQMLMMDFLKLRRLGVTPSEALGDGWKAIAARADDRPRSALVAEALERVAGPAVLQSRHGSTVRNAVDDRLSIRETAARLSAADKAMVPDVEPTAEALLERIGSLAGGLERLERDVPGEAMAQLDARIAMTRAEPEHAPDRERRLTLLTRQQASLQELLDRRGTMQRQLESASVALRSLRFDLVKLQTLGVGSAMRDDTQATQEARAVSADIRRALEAAEEVRAL